MAGAIPSRLKRRIGWAVPLTRLVCSVFLGFSIFSVFSGLFGFAAFEICSDLFFVPI
jgi:hypothetical protein